MNTHPPTHWTYPKCHSVSIHILWMAHGVGGGWRFMGWVVVGLVVGGFMGWVGVMVWVVVGCMVGWAVGEFMGG